MKNVRNAEPVPKLVKLSYEFSNVHSNIAYFPTLENREEIKKMNKYELNKLIGALENGVSNLNEAKKFAVTTNKQLSRVMNGDISNIQLAKVLGVSASSVSRWLSNTTKITQDNLKKIANYFKFSVEYLTGEYCLPYYELEKKNNNQKNKEIKYLNDFGISNYDKKILESCGFFLIDPYSSKEYYKGEIIEIDLFDNQQLNENEWIPWLTTIYKYEKFPQKLALIRLSDLKKMNIDYWNINEPIKYSKEIEKKAQYVDFKKLKCIIEDRKSMLAFNFEKSLESIK